MLIWNTVEVQILEFHMIIILINLLPEGVGLYNITILENYIYIYTWNRNFYSLTYVIYLYILYVRVKVFNSSVILLVYLPAGPSEVYRSTLKGPSH